MIVDTNVVIWWLDERFDRLTPSARSAVEGVGDLTISTIAIWEIAIKRSVGRLRMPDDVVDRLVATGATLLPITPRHADRVSALPFHHRDPFDRMLVAQAQIEGMPILSSDETLRSYDVEVIW